MVNEAIVVGYLGQDPELRETGSGTAVCNFSVATTRKWTTKDGDKKEDTQWHRIVVWGLMGENASKYLGKGKPVYVRGRMQTRDWETKDGEKRQTTEIHAVDVKYLPSGNSSNASSGGDSPPPNDDDDIPF